MNNDLCTQGFRVQVPAAPALLTLVLWSDGYRPVTPEVRDRDPLGQLLIMAQWKRSGLLVRGLKVQAEKVRAWTSKGD